jgi:drug/metabolite transporter (DMT)-like permease
MLRAGSKGFPMSERIGVLAALLSSALGGVAAGATRFVVADVDPLTLAALRFGGGFLVLLPIVLVLRQPWPKGRDWIGVALFGLLYFCAYQVLYNTAFISTTAARGSMVGSTLAFLTMVVAALAGVERLSRRKVIGVLVATGGVAVALASGLADAAQGAWRGDLMMLAGIFCWACHSVWSRPFIQRSSPLTFVAAGMGIGTACLLALALIRGGFATVALLGPAQWIAVSYLAIFGGAVAFYLWVFALQRASPTRVASTIAVHPISASIVAAVVPGEPIGLNLAVGVVAVLAGIWIAAGEAAQPSKAGAA